MMSSIGPSMLKGWLVAGAMALASSAVVPAYAKVVRIAIDETRPVSEPGSDVTAGPYELLRGRLFGEIDPTDPKNAIIQDIGTAPRNTRGLVEYISTFTLLKPVDPARGSGVLIEAFPNRGGRGVASWRTARTIVDPMFYQQGYSTVWVGWQGDLPEHPSASGSAAGLKLESILVPVARKPGGKSLTGPYLVRVPTVGGNGVSGAIMRIDQGGAGALAYPPSSYDTRRAKLTGGPPENIEGKPMGSRYVIASQDWMWWDCKADTAPAPETDPGDLCIKRLKGTFVPTQSYTLVFEARDPLVLGLGMAALRDAASFFRYQDADDAGTLNPLRDHVDHVIAQGVSQVGNLIKTVIALGFTADEKGRKVWDGAHAHIAGRRTPINYRFATPGSSASLYMPGNEGVLWWGKARNSVRGGPAESMLDRCTASQTCPKIFESFGGAELWNQRMSSGMVTLDLKQDIPLPANVRRYYFPGTQHGGGQGGFGLTHSSGMCTLPLNPNPQSDQMRALMLSLVDWVARDKAPPPSAYPTLAAGNLVQARRGEFAFPDLPGVASPYGLANPLLIYDYGRKFDYADLSGVISKLPPRIIDVVPALVAQVDKDGNETSGVPSVQMMAPLGTYLSWNTYDKGPYAGQICSFNAGFVPFARTSEERLAANDPRLSIEERYQTRAGYIEAVTAAVEKAQRNSFLLAADGARLIYEARQATEIGQLSFLKP